eukprot:scaffold7615_cov286-Pinguiococcus_pyrenoidosus.AAC.4
MRESNPRQLEKRVLNCGHVPSARNPREKKSAKSYGIRSRYTAQLENDGSEEIIAGAHRIFDCDATLRVRSLRVQLHAAGKCSTTCLLLPQTVHCNRRQIIQHPLRTEYIFVMAPRRPNSRIARAI